MLLTKTVMVKWNPANAEYYKEKGYTFTKWRDGFEVKIEDLSKGSHAKIDILCDYCNLNIITREYKDYLTKKKNSAIQKDCCLDCKSLKTKESNLMNYNVESVLNIPEVKYKISKTRKQTSNDVVLSKAIQDKRKATNRARFGVDHPSQNEEINQKMKQTNLDRYGFENVFQNEEIKEKSRNTNMLRYGFEYPMQNKEVREKGISTNQKIYGVDNYTQTEEYKIRSVAISLEHWGTKHPMQNEEVKARVTNTMLKNWGVENSMQNEELRNKAFTTNIERYGFKCSLQNEEVRAKAIMTMFLSDTCPTSKQQRYVYEVIKKQEIDVVLNYPVGSCSLDMAFPNKMVFIEWDGGGHDLDVKLGSMSKEEFDAKERRRYYYLNKLGWKSIRIISKKDVVPTEDKILEILNHAELTFKEGHSWITFDIDDNTATNRNGFILYDFGELKRVKTEQVLNKII